MECSKCGEKAVVRQAYSGLHLCETHLYESVEKRVKARIREDNLLEGQERWVVGLSGGKDSSVLLYILNRIFDENPNVELIGLTLDEGIEGYRDESVEASRQLTDELGVRHEVVEFETEFDVTIDDVTEQKPEQKPCAYCGVFRRTALNKHAERLGATKLLTGHNLDDVAQTALMNFLDGDVERMARHYRASLSSDPEHEDDYFVKRAKPLRDVPEKEVALYAMLKDIPTYLEECPNAEGATRGDARDLLLEYERKHPGTRHSLMNAYEEIGEILNADRESESERKKLNECENCGAPTKGDICRTCSLLSEVA